MQKIARRKVAQHIAQQLADGTAPAAIAKQTAAYLIDTNQTKQLELLLRDVEAALLAHDLVTVHVTSAHELDASLRTTIESFIRETHKAKSSIIASETIDKDLIGGVIVQTPSRVFDTSIRTKLKNLTAQTKAA